jgi:eukaryotic-like serine/threonine-protein kinase
VAHPEKLGKYRITGVLGEGAMGVVYRGFDPDIRRVVALKTIRRLGGGDGVEAAHQSAARFRNEAQAAGRLLHPGIVGVYDFGETTDGRVAYIAMEYVEGHTLAAYLARRVRFTDADIASMGLQLLDALGHAHENGVWHRDVKPSNVIMTKSGRIKIADFGIARTDNTGLTMANSVLGTPMYMAPEQFMGKAIDHRVDLYGAGVVLYQLVAGRPPFVGPPESLMYKVVNEIPLPPSAAEGARTGALFDAVVARALAKSPGERWPHATAFRDALQQALHQGTGALVPGSVSHEAVHALPLASEYAPTERIPPPQAPATAGSGLTGTGSAPTHWEPGALAKVEAALARHVGPLAAVMVRRAARECHDMPALYARLGEQITQASAREAFLGQMGAGGTGSQGGGSGSTGGNIGQRRATPTGGSSGTNLGGGGTGAPVSDALLEQAQRLLAAHVGPIAKVVVKRAAERSREREVFFGLLAEAVPEASRSKLLAELARLAGH